jgi:4'-phosphopantetheinyl transferase
MRNIDLWLAFYDEIIDERLLAQLRQLLSNAERQQEQRFYFADDRKCHLVTRAMVRTVLSRYEAVAPADWVFATNIAMGVLRSPVSVKQAAICVSTFLTRVA